MRAAILFALGLAGFSRAATIDPKQCLNYAINNIPACGLNCIISAASGINCGPTDVACQCKNFSQLQANALGCVLSGCGAQTGLQVQSIANNLCAGKCSGGNSATDACLSYAVNSIPTCGLNCIISAGGKEGCGPTDVKCQCAKFSQLQADALPCVLSGCGAQTGLQVQSIANNLCAGKCQGSGSGSGAGSAGSSSPAGSAAMTTGTAAASGSSDSGMMGMGSSSPAATGGSGLAGQTSAPASVTAGGALVSGSIAGAFAGVLGLLAAL